MTATTITVNTQARVVFNDHLSYEDLLRLAGYDSRYLYTVTVHYKLGEFGASNFQVLPNDTVRVRHDMVVSVADTSNA